MTKDEIVAALERAENRCVEAMKTETFAAAIGAGGRAARIAHLYKTDADLFKWLAASFAKGQEALANDIIIWVHPHEDRIGARPIWIIPLDEGKPTTADEILAKMKPLPQAPDDGGKQT